MFPWTDQAIRHVQNDAVDKRVSAAGQGAPRRLLRGSGLRRGGEVQLRVGRASRQGQHVRPAPGERHVERNGWGARQACE